MSGERPDSLICCINNRSTLGSHKLERVCTQGAIAGTILVFSSSNLNIAMNWDTQTMIQVRDNFFKYDQSQQNARSTLTTSGTLNK